MLLILPITQTGMGKTLYHEDRDDQCMWEYSILGN